MHCHINENSSLVYEEEKCDREMLKTASAVFYSSVLRLSVRHKSGIVGFKSEWRNWEYTKYNER